jgi:peptide/nickel transport system substrate-binding protein
MKRTWSYVTLAVLVIAALVLTACRPPATESPTTAPAERKVLRIILTQEPDSLNPLYTSMWFAALLDQVGLCWAWEFDSDNAAFPRLVTEIPSVENGGVSEDGLVITLHLRDDIVWSDDTPITSADFLFTYDIIMDPANSVDSQYPYDMLASLEAPDERTVVMRFDEPFTPWLGTFWRVVLPKHVLEPVYQEQGSIAEAEWNLAPTVGCGPYVFAEWESGSFIRYERNESYWAGQAKIDEVYVQFVPDDASQTAAFIAGDADVGTFPPLSDVPSLREAGLEIKVQSSGYDEGWFFNFRDMANPAIQDVRVRQAIAQALNRQAIVDDLLLGLTTVAESYWDGMPEYVSPDIQAWTFDQAAATQLLEDAGWTDTNGDGIREDANGNDLTLVHCTTTRESRQDIQAVAQQQLREVGIDLQIQNYDSDILFGSYTDGGPCAVGDCDIMEWSDVPTGFPDPDTDYWLCGQIPDDENPWGYNYFGCDEELDALFRQQLTTINATQRRDVVRQISKDIHDQVYWLGLYSDPDYWIVSGRLSNVSFSGVTPLYSIMEWEITE